MAVTTPGASTSVTRPRSGHVNALSSASASRREGWTLVTESKEGPLADVIGSFRALLYFKMDPNHSVCIALTICSESRSCIQHNRHSLPLPP